MGAKDYEVVLCNNGFLYINKDDGNDAISKDSKRLSERDLEEIKNWIDKNHEYVRTDAFIEKACKFLSNKANIPLWEGYNYTFGCDTPKLVENFIKYMKGE